MGGVHRVTLAFWIILLAILINPAVGVAQSCEPLPVDGSPLSYRFRTNVPRCEGMYRSPVSGHLGMTLVSLTYGKIAYDKRDQYLEITLTAEPAETTLIQAVGIPERLYYRLDAELGKGKSVFRLPLGDVVAANNISPEQFGIYAVRKLPGSQNASWCGSNPMGSSLLRHADHGTRHPDAPANSWHFLSRVRLSGTNLSNWRFAAQWAGASAFRST
jgi:hypothetical protein